MNFKRISQAILTIVLSLTVFVTSATAVFAETIKIGGNYELSGDLASYGSSMAKGLELAVKEANDNGGILDGQDVEAVIYDNKSDTTESLSVTQRLISDGVVGIVGPSTTANAEAEIPAVMEANIPTVFPAVTGEGITEDKDGKVLDYIFRVCFSNDYQGTVAGLFSAENLKAKKAVVLIDQSSDYSQGLADTFIAEFEKHGGEIVGQEFFDGSESQVDATAVLGNLLGQDFDVIYLPTYYVQAGQVIKQAREAGLEQAVVGPDGFASDILIEQAGAENTNNVFYTTHFTDVSDEPVVKDFLKAFEDLHGEKPDTFAALGYDAARVVIQAVEEAGTSDTKKVAEAIASMKGFEGVTGTFGFDELHNPTKPALMIELADGKIKETLAIDAN